MEPKPSKGKGVASSSHGSKCSKRASEEEHDDVSHSSQPLRCYGLIGSWSTKGDSECWVIIKNVLRGMRVKKSQSFGFGVSFDSIFVWTVGPRFEEPLYDDVVTEDEMERVDSKIESSDVKEDFEIGEAPLAPTDDEN
ncbi:hypothetical protein HAX54_040103 [Datura stramonium]|uniref:Uncharacterized protein n=1 Tax=Datura stramonium TaxID=4076 RepID=A0ABS8SJZ9_DATST|nr:hypothetical protein [Datura stramonium]